LKTHDKNQFIEVQHFDDSTIVHSQNNHQIPQGFNTDNQTNITNETTEISIENYKNSVLNDAIQLISKWYNKSIIPRKHVQHLIEDIIFLKLI